MKTLNGIVNELFDKPAKLKKTKDDDEYLEYAFEIDGNNYSVYMGEIDIHLNNEEVLAWEIGFRNEDAKGGKHFKLSGKGNELKVFDTVIDAIKIFIRRMKPDVIYFDAKEVNRQSLYQTMIKKLIKGYKTTTQNIDGEKRFILTKK